MTRPLQAEKGSFKGSFSWVNHDAENLQSRPHRKRVFTHIQTRYRTFERETRTKALRTSARILPKTDLQAVPTLVARNKDDSLRGKKARKSSVSALSPPVLKGNSDPFSVYAVEITPQVNELLTFYRDLFIPSVYHTGPQGWKLSKVANAEWRRRMDGLRDKGNALTFLARQARIASIATRNSKLGLEALSFSAKSTSELRTRLEKDGTIDSAVYWHISLLWGIEILMRNFKGAIVHGKMLNSLLRNQSVSGNVDLTMLRAVLYNDAHLLCMTMQPSVFDYETWIPNTCKPLRLLAEKHMPSLAEPQKEALDPTIEGDFLKSVVTERRQHTSIWAQYPDLSGSVSTAVDAWLSMKCHMHVGQMVKHFLKCMQEADRSLPSTQGYLYAQAYLSLAILYSTRTIRAGFMMVCGVEIHDSQRMLLGKLREALYRAEVFEDDVDRLIYRNAKLYALFIGAQAERTLPLDRRTDDYGWFNNELVSLAKQMELSEWSDGKEILQGFLYVDRIQPNGSQWWGKTLISPSSQIETKILEASASKASKQDAPITAHKTLK
ncbi:hypothetical protein H2200_005026 [Cladophialophora chaetospira]|uniref:Uncharacterized protein n=1 Tax=Cladophialophora chaetospira TaxID=386627 RepID=A0AA38XBU9_9EURO|nr:hypothetical protein H2200_005026 [Cladophialophora chaetospira]